MRTQEQINYLKQTHSRPVQAMDLIDQDKVDFLLDYYYSSNDIVQKNTGPKSLHIKQGDGLVDDVIDKLKDLIGEFDVRAIQFFDVTSPHVLHNDDDSHYPNTYKAVTLPLYIEGEGVPKLVFFDQYYYHGPVKLFNGRKKDPEVFYNQPLTEYSKLENINTNPIPEYLKGKLLGHLKDKWLEGLSIQSYFPWIIGSGIIFDSLQIHCASNFLAEGVTRKIGLSIFTQK